MKKKFRPTNVKKSMIEERLLEAIVMQNYITDIMLEIASDADKYDLNVKLDKSHKKELKSYNIRVTKLNEAIKAVTKLVL